MDRREEPPHFLAIVGPTGSGKTALSLRVSGVLGGEIISLDSRQVYRGMDIGTAKVAPSERARVLHHGLDLLPPNESYSAGRFAREARQWIAEIRDRGRVPILAGGTGFFLRVLMDPIFEEPCLDGDRLAALRRWMANQSVKGMERWVEHLDRNRAEAAREGGPHRMGRTIEIALLTGRPLSWWHRNAKPSQAGVPGAGVLLRLPKEELHRRIHDRTEGMFEKGLVEEVRGLLAAGYTGDDPGLSGTGYREVIAFIEGETTLEETKRRVRIATRQYARRQRTWFRNQLPAAFLRLEALRPLDELTREIAAAWCRASGLAPGAAFGPSPAGEDIA